MRILISLAALALTGCPGRGAATRTALVDSVITDTTDTRGRLLRELQGEVRASYQRATLDASAAAASIDPSVGLVAIGVGPSDLAVGLAPGIRWPVVSVARKPIEIVSRALEVHVSADETVGWSFDEATLELPVCGRTATIPLRIFQVYVRDSDRWTLVAEHLGYAQAMGRWLDAAVGPDGIRMPEAIERQPESSAALAAIAEAISPDGDRAATWDDSADAIAVWPEAMQVLRGGTTRTGPSLAASLDASGLGLDGVRLALGPSRGVAIASTTLSARIQRGGGTGDLIDVRLRATFVVERSGEGKDASWRVRAAMVSIPITAGALVGRTVGVTAGPPIGGNVTTTCR